MGEVLRPRGRDGAGLFPQGPVALAHRRLHVTDPSEHAQQPMTDAALGLSLVFNGCIYNDRALRREHLARHLLALCGQHRIEHGAGVFRARCFTRPRACAHRFVDGLGRVAAGSGAKPAVVQARCSPAGPAGELPDAQRSDAGRSHGSPSLSPRPGTADPDESARPRPMARSGLDARLSRPPCRSPHRPGRPRRHTARPTAPG